MRKVVAVLVSAVCMGVMLALAAHAGAQRMVYLKDGGTIECQSVSKKDGKVVILVNRDTLVELAPEEVDLAKTFGKGSGKTGKKRVKTRPRLVVDAPSATVDDPPASKGNEIDVSPKPGSVNSTTQNVSPVAKPESPAAQKAEGAKVVPAPAPMAPPSAQVAVPSTSSVNPMPGKGILVALLLFVVLIIASFWKVYEKAGEAGWKSLIPIYNLYVLVQISGKPWWWFLLLFVPLVNVAISILVHLALASRFGKGPLFGLGLVFFGFIFFPILAFDKSVYS